MHKSIEKLREEIRELIARYELNRDEYLSSNYDETSLRIEFLNPLFTVLGWDVNNAAGLSIYAREVIHEANVTVDDEDDAHANKKPDYAFRIGGETKFFLEAKKPSVNIRERREPAFQVRRYGWNGNHAISVLCNFEDLSIYDCGYRPIDTQEASFARIAHYHYDQFAEHLEDIYFLISKEAVSGGSLERVDAHEQAVKMPFDDMFFEQITSWRADIVLDLYSRYGIADTNELNRFAQVLINRIIFLRVCEDRNFENAEELLSITTYDELRTAFAAADEKYDSGLFNYLDDAPWQVSSYLLISIFQDLYYPNSSYDFNVVQPHVIGQIYEKFLGERVYIEDGRIAFEALPESIESNGVVSTPKEITDAIVANTLHDIEFPCRVADICCGSGNFLLSAYELLVSKEILRLTHDNNCSIELIERTSGPDLPYWRKRQILSEAIYGVDIDPRAVEVAQLNLSLRLLEGCSSEELSAYCTQSGNELLPDLSENIKCGNSLVDYSYFEFDPSARGNINTLRTIRPFDWSNEFPFSGFDAIIGNPPYIRVQNLAKYTPAEYNYYRSEYCNLQVASAPLLDKYQLFVERALGLLKDQGKLGMILPNKFMTIKTGESLRTLLTTQYHVSRIVDFGAIQVFPDRSTYTCILVATPHEVSKFTRHLVMSLPDFISEPLQGGVEYSVQELTSKAWSFTSGAISRHMLSIRDKCSKLSDLVNIFVGLQTSKDAAYIFNPISESEDCFVFQDINGRNSKVEKALCKPCLLDVEFEPYDALAPNRQIIFPYLFSNDKPFLIPISALEEKYPHTYEYLCSIKGILDQRAVQPKRQGEDWHKFGRAQSLNKFHGAPHIIWPVLSRGPKYVIDRSGSIMFTGGGNGPYYGLELKDGTPESIEYIQAVLCYWLTEELVRCKTSIFRGEYYAHGKQFMAELPIRRINFKDTTEVSIHDRIVALVRQIEDLIVKRKFSHETSDITLFTRSIDATKKTLENVLDTLYGADSSLKETINYERCHQ